MGKNLLAVGLSLLGLILISCGSSTSSGGGGGTVATTGAITSLVQLPDVDTMVQGGATAVDTNGNIAAKAVTGATNAPVLVGITSDTAKTLFWKTDTGNMVDDINEAGSATQNQQSDFWIGEGSCRMAQMVGYSMQNIKQAGTSTCFMKNMPDVIGVEGVTVASGSNPVTSTDSFFSKQANDFILKVNVTNEPDNQDGGSQIVYIKVYGTNNLSSANDYDVDLWFCADTTSTANGSEQIRYNGTTGLLIDANLETSFGSTFSSTFAATVTTDSHGVPTFDSTSDRTATSEFVQTGDMTSVDKNVVRVSESDLFAKNYHHDADNDWKNFAVAQYNGDTMSTIKFLQAGFKGINGTDENNSWEGSTEFQTNHYEGTNLISALSDSGLVSSTDAFTFAGDDFFSTAPSASDVDTSSLTNLNCNPTVNYTITMDFADPAVIAVAALCQNNFQDMNFCDAGDIQTARNLIFQSFQ